jgi:hypothetical protein
MTFCLKSKSGILSLSVMDKSQIKFGWEIEISKKVLFDS